MNHDILSITSKMRFARINPLFYTVYYGSTIAEAARNAGVNANMLGRWKREIENDGEDISGTGSMKVLLSELKRFCKENQRLKMEREIKKKAVPPQAGPWSQSEISIY